MYRPSLSLCLIFVGAAAAGGRDGWGLPFLPEYEFSTQRAQRSKRENAEIAGRELPFLPESRKSQMRRGDPLPFLPESQIRGEGWERVRGCEQE